MSETKGFSVRIKSLVLALSFCPFAQAQQTQGGLTDKRIYDLFKSGVQINEILRIIATAPEVEFDLRPAATFDLMKAGLSAEIIKAMAAREKGTPIEPEVALPQRPSSQMAGATFTSWEATPDQRTYYKSNGQWIQIEPEVVRRKSGLGLKTYATAGLLKSPTTVQLSNSAADRVRLVAPVQFRVYCPEGKRITEYQLVRLRAHPSSGRLLIDSESEGATDSFLQDAIHGIQRIAARMWTININVGPGEYGLLAPAGTPNNGGQASNVYAFTVVK